MGEKYVQEEFLGQESLGEKSMQEEFLGEESLGEESLGEKYMGEKYVQEEFLGEKYQKGTPPGPTNHILAILLIFSYCLFYSCCYQ